MATPFTEIFDQFLETEIDDGSFALIPDDLFYKKLSTLLKRSRNKFRDIILKNSTSITNKAEDVIEFQRETYNFTETGTSATVTLDPAPPTGSAFYVSVNDVETQNFTFTTPDQLEITDMPDQSNEIYVGAYVNGQFNQTLNLTEIGLFVDLMGLYYLHDKVKKETLIVHAVEGRDYSHSGTQGNHIRALKDQLEFTTKEVEQDIIMYAYRNFGFQYNASDANGYLG